MKMFLVLSPSGGEGYATTDRDDAESVADGIWRSSSHPTVGEAFREAYCEDIYGDDDPEDIFEEPRELRLVEIEVPDA